MAIEAISSASQIDEVKIPQSSALSKLETTLKSPQSIEEIRLERGNRWLNYLQHIMEERSSLPASDAWEIPPHLTKVALVKKREEDGQLDPKFWLERSNKTEVRVKEIIESQTKFVEEVKMNDPYTEGSDLEVFFVNGFPLSTVKIEVKSSWKAMTAWKGEIRDDLIKTGVFTLAQWQEFSDLQRELIIKGNLTQNHKMLINGGVSKRNTEKTEKEILYDAFYPQLIRIIEYDLTGTTTEPIIVFPL